MPTLERSVRQSVTLPPRVARRIRALAKSQCTSASRVIAGLVQTVLESVDQEEKRFFALTDRLVASRDPSEKKRIKEGLARMTLVSNAQDPMDWSPAGIV